MLISNGIIEDFYPSLTTACTYLILSSSFQKQLKTHPLCSWLVLFLLSLSYITCHFHLYFLTISASAFADGLANFFTEKYLTFVYLCLTTPPRRPHTQSPSHHTSYHLYLQTCLWIWNLQDLAQLPNKQSDSDSIPTSLLKDCASVLTPIITNCKSLS